MSEPTKEDLIESLWEASLGEDTAKCGEEVRHETAIKALALLRGRFRNAMERGDEKAAAVSVSAGNLIWALLAAEAAGWLLEFSLSKDEETWQDASARQLLLGLGELQNAAIPPTHREAIDPVSLMLPRWLFSRLGEALRALDAGEVHPLVQPLETGRHNKAWTWDSFRSQALEHVEFLRGQGVLAKVARGRVADAMKISDRTLEHWALEFGKHADNYAEAVAVARAAGEYKAQLESNPDFAKRDGQSVDSKALFLFRQIQKEPLRDFGMRFREYSERAEYGETR